MSRSVKQLCKQLLSELSRPIVFLTGKVDKRSNSSTTATLATQRYLNRKFVFQPLKLFKETIVFNNSVVNKWAERKTSLYIFIEQTTFLLNFWTAPSQCLKITFKKSHFSTIQVRHLGVIFKDSELLSPVVLSSGFSFLYLFVPALCKSFRVESFLGPAVSCAHL